MRIIMPLYRVGLGSYWIATDDLLGRGPELFYIYVVPAAYNMIFKVQLSRAVDAVIIKVMREI